MKSTRPVLSRNGRSTESCREDCGLRLTTICWAVGVTAPLVRSGRLHDSFGSPIGTTRGTYVCLVCTSIAAGLCREIPTWRCDRHKRP
jgi:hypothetical protein